jgi:hypothetical protein
VKSSTGVEYGGPQVEEKDRRGRKTMRRTMRSRRRKNEKEEEAVNEHGCTMSKRCLGFRV